jgi:hypothetical protein
MAFDRATGAGAHEVVVKPPRVSFIHKTFTYEPSTAVAFSSALPAKRLRGSLQMRTRGWQGALPCETGRTKSITTPAPVAPTAPLGATASAAAPSEKRPCVGKELQINFSSMPVKTTLHVLADFSGHKLVVDPSISEVGAFKYGCTPWDSVLQDIATRYNLVVKVEGGTIFVTKR